MSVAPPGSPHPLPIRPSIFQQGCHPHALIIDGGNAVSIGVVALVGGVLLGYKFFVAILVLRPSMLPGCAREHREPQCCALNTFTARCTRDFANEPLSSTYRLDPRDDIDGDGRSLTAPRAIWDRLWPRRSPVLLVHSTSPTGNFWPARSAPSIC
jgi:hypothetical protein